VLRAAVRLVEANGIEALTMRKLARALGVEAMSLYNHVAKKGDLVDAIVDLVIGEIELPAGADDWRVAIRRYAISAHRVFLQNPWACSLAIAPTSTPAPGGARLRNTEWLLAWLRKAGFSPKLAYRAYHVLDSHVLGFTLWQLGHAAATKNLGDASERSDLVANLLHELHAGDYPHLAEHVEQHLNTPSGEGEREFQFALDLILDGLEKARTGA
jgi:AcrR family transcriptional regulator